MNALVIRVGIMPLVNMDMVRTGITVRVLMDLTGRIAKLVCIR